VDVGGAREELGHDKAAIPIDRAGAKITYVINPREVKYDPRTIKKAALIFYAAGEDWTMASRVGTRPTSACSRATTTSAARAASGSTRRWPSSGASGW